MGYWPFIRQQRISANERKMSRSGPLLSINTLLPARWTPRRYDKLAEAGYQRNVIAYRCIRLIAQSVASIPLLVQDGQGRDLVAHPLLRLLTQPNPTMSKMAFIETIISQQLIAGNAYIEAVRGDGGQPPRELWPLRPDRMKIIAGGSGLPMAYEYGAGGKTVRWPADPVTGQSDILHLKSFHPIDDWYGQGPLEAALLSIDQHNEASQWNQSLLQNAARPSGALVYAPKDGPNQLSDTQFTRLKQELHEQMEGANNAGRPLLLEGGLEWRAMSLSPTDMDWKQGRDAVARDIALAFGVPAQLIGLPDAQTYANLREARLSFYEETVLPLAFALRDALSGWVLPMFGDDLTLALDLDEVSALALRREALWSKVAEADFLTTAEKRQALGYSAQPQD